MIRFVGLFFNRFIFIMLAFIIMFNYSCATDDRKEKQTQSNEKSIVKLKGIFLEYADTLKDFYFIDTLCLSELYTAFDGIIWNSDSGYSLEFGLVFTPKNFIDYKELNQPSEKQWISFLINNLNSNDTNRLSVLFMQYDMESDCLRPCFMGDNGVLIVDSIYSFTPIYSNLRNNCFFQMQDTSRLPGGWERIDNETHLPIK
jgi:hypothetical protein